MTRIPHGHPPQNRRQVAGCRVDLAEDGGTLKFLSRRLALFLVALVGLSLAPTGGTAAAACPSSCTQQLAACKQTCPGSGQARRDCRAACAERSTCTAPGARIRTLAYVLTECSQDPQGIESGKTKLLIRRGNCDPVTVMEAATTVPAPLGICRIFGET